MLKKFLIFNLIFSLNIICSETQIKMKHKQVEINSENLEYLYETLTKAGLEPKVHSKILLSYLTKYSFVSFIKTDCCKANILPNDTLALLFYNKIQICDFNGNVIQVFEGEMFTKIKDLCLLKDQLLAIAYPNAILTWDSQTGERLKCMHVKFNIKSLCYLDDNKLAIITDTKIITVLDINNGIILKEIECCQYSRNICLLKNNLKLSSDKNIQIAVSGPYATEILDVESGRCLRMFAPFVELCALPNGKLACTFEDDKNINIFDVHSGELLKILEDDGCKKIYSINLLSDELLASASCMDGQIRIWDINIGKCVQVLDNAHNGMEILSIANGKFATFESMFGQTECIRLWGPVLDLIPQKVCNKTT